MKKLHETQEVSAVTEAKQDRKKEGTNPHRTEDEEEKEEKKVTRQVLRRKEPQGGAERRRSNGRTSADL